MLESNHQPSLSHLKQCGTGSRDIAHLSEGRRSIKTDRIAATSIARKHSWPCFRTTLPSSPARATETAKQIKADGGRADGFALDVSNRADCNAVAKRIADDIGRVSILVNNAGITRRSGIGGDADTVAREWDDIIGVNLNGVFNVTHAFLAPLRANKGRIVNLGSIQSFVHVRTPSSPAYTASKHGVLGFTRALAAELGKDGIRVNAIGPGLIETAINANARANHPEMIKTFIDHTPLGRAGQPEDIVGPAIFLASDLSAYVTGSIVMADGGYRTV